MTEAAATATVAESQEAEIAGADSEPGVSYPLVVQYCGECSMPLEYCAFSGKPEKCRQWLEKNLSQLAGNLSVAQQQPKEGGKAGEGATAAATTTMADGNKEGAATATATTAEGEGGDKKHQKRGGKGSHKEPKSDKAVNLAPKAMKVTLSTATRGKNKSITVIKGLLAFGIDAKVASKFFSSKFACGCSVSGGDELSVQGDVKDKLFDVIPEKWPQVTEDCIVDGGDHK